MSEQVRRAIVQHAETAAMLGAESIPAYRPSGAAPSRSASPSPAGGPNPPVPASRAGPGRDEPVLHAPASAPERPRRDPAQAQARLDELRARYERDAPHRQFNTTFNKIVFGEGDPCARLMFVGEAPGAEEDKSGRPFVGKAGDLLTRMINAMGLQREQVYIANVLKTRPPNNATPTIDEMTLCAPYLYEQVAIVNPEVLVTLGKPAAQCLLDISEALGKFRGVWTQFPPPGRLGPVPGLERPIPVMPTYHPAYLLRAYTDDNRAKVWSDLKQVMDRLGLKPTKRP